MRGIISILLAICITLNSGIYISAETVTTVVEDESNNEDSTIDEDSTDITENVDEGNSDESLESEQEDEIIEPPTSSNDNQEEALENIEDQLLYVNTTGDLKSFKFESKKNEGNLSYDIQGYFIKNIIYCFLPSQANIENLVATYESNTSEVKVNGVVQKSGETKNNFSNDLKYVLGENIYEIKVMKSDIPTIEIETEGKKDIVSKEDYLNASMKISGTPQYTTGLYNGNIKIRGRGNSTWNMEKKPYRIKLDSNSEILGMDKEKDWVLLANYTDKSLIRNKLAFELAKSFGLEYTPDSVFVDVILNGEYKGNYLLCEQIEVSKTRVNISELDEENTDDSEITGGYLLEIDARKDADVWFNTSKGISICFKSPKNPNSKQLEYIKKYFDEFESALYSDNFRNSSGKHYSDYIDVDSFANWYLINEIFKNNDAALHSSVYLYKDRDGKLCMGPVWDFDIAAGNINYNGNDNPEEWWIKNSKWFSRIFKDPEFANKVERRYKELEGVIDNIDKQIDAYAKQINKSQNMNFIRWDILNKYVWPNACVTGSYQGEIDYLKGWLNKRINWISNNLGNIGVPSYQSFIDNPKEGTNIKGNTEIKGWYIYGNTIDMVEVLIDGKLDGVANRYSRPDVGNVHTEYDISKAGFKYNLDTTKYENGKHTITIKANSEDGTSHTTIRVVNIQNSILYKTHVEEIGWQDWKFNGQTSGTQGESKRLEAISIDFNDAIPGGTVSYRTHVEGIGWQPWKSNGEISGTIGESKRLEAIEINIENAKGYNIEYRVHVQDIGWQDWRKNGQLAGTTGESKRLEAIEIRVVEAVNVEYRAHIESYGWQEIKRNGATSGTTGESKRIEAVEINLSDLLKGARVLYRSHIQDIGWQDWKKNGQLSGTTGESKRLEAIEIKLENAPGYSIEYRTHIEELGWQDWKKNGQLSGTVGESKRIEAIEIRLLKN